MEISGLVKTSLIDYPEQISAVVFTQGCNFACGFCHNPELIGRKKGTIQEEEVISFLKNRTDKLDGVVITGGEPTIQKDLLQFVEKIKSLGLKVKLDTNGSNPKIVRELIEKRLVDYVACDIKGPLESYSTIAKYLNTKFVQETIFLLLKGEVGYEFRTTVLPYYHQLGDFEKIGQIIAGASLYTVQGFRNTVTLDKKLMDEEPFPAEKLSEIAVILEKYVDRVVIHQNLA